MGKFIFNPFHEDEGVDVALMATGYFDARYVQVAGDTMTGGLTITGGVLTVTIPGSASRTRTEQVLIEGYSHETDATNALFNVNHLASDGNRYLMSAQTLGVDKFYVDNDGDGYFSGGLTLGTLGIAGPTADVSMFSSANNGVKAFTYQATNIERGRWTFGQDGSIFTQDSPAKNISFDYVTIKRDIDMTSTYTADGYLLKLESQVLNSTGGTVGYLNVEDKLIVDNNGYLTRIDSHKDYWGAANDYSIEWDGSDAVHTISAGDFVFTGGNGGFGTTTPAKRVEIFETVADAQLRISYDATKFVDFQVKSGGSFFITTTGSSSTFIENALQVQNGSITIDNVKALAIKDNGGTSRTILQITSGNLTRIGSSAAGLSDLEFNAGESVAAGIKLKATSGDVHITTGDLQILNDSKYTYYGAAKDAFIGFDGNSLNICANDVTSTDDLILQPNGGSVGVGKTPNAGFLLDILLSATDTRGINVDGTANDFTGSGDVSTVAMNFARDANVGTGEPTNLTALTLTCSLKHTEAQLNNNNKNSRAANLVIVDTSTWSNDSVTNRTSTFIGVRSEADNNATFSSTSSGRITSTNQAILAVCDFDGSFDDNGSLAINRLFNIGVDADVDSNPTLTSGSLTHTNYGVRINVLSNAVGTATNYGLYITTVSGADSNYGIWDASGADWVLDGDSQKIIWGEGQDASAYWDNADFVIDPQEAAAGHYVVLNTGKTTTGDPAGKEGMIYWNTIDNVIKMYVDSAWRTLASW